MKRTILIGFLCFVFLMAYGYGKQTRPVAVSPGSESGLAVVNQSCPTFSWSAVSWSQAYKVEVFPAVGAEVLTYEEMELLASPIVRKEIQGLALSWTPSEEVRLTSGEAYVWYVQAVDALGVGVWSEGRMFQVEEDIRLVGVKERLRKSLKEYGMSDEDIERVVTDAASGLQEVAVQESSEMAPAYIGVDQGTEGSSNTYYGYLAGDLATGTHNSFFGRAAGYQTTGNYNTFVGYYVGRYNQSGSYNTMMGRGSGKLCVTGSYNTYIGAFSGHHTTSSNNTMLGACSGYSNTSGTQNTFLGTYAGYYNTIGSGNTFLGDSTGCFNSTGAHNTFLGNQSGYANTAGGSNTFIGYSAGTYNTTGVGNTILGNEAGFSNTIGKQNTFLGHYAGCGNVDGDFNTYIGYDTGSWNYSGSYNVFLGCQAGSNETGSNKLYIDNSSTSSPLIWGDFNANEVVINSYLGVGVNPTHRIDVTGGAYCTGTTWVDVSSREYKENIMSLDAEEALEAFEKLEPVKFNYKQDKEEDSVGFIAEDVPDLVATNDRKGMVAMDVVAVLTKVVQEQQKALNEQKKVVQNQQVALNEQQKVAQQQQNTIDELRKQIDDLKKRK